MPNTTDQTINMGFGNVDHMNINGKYVICVYYGSQKFWCSGETPPDAEAPGQIPDLFMESGLERVTAHFTHPTGYPDPICDLYQDGVMIAANVFSPYLHIVDAGVREYRIRAHNLSGESWSGYVDGESIAREVPGYISDFLASEGQEVQVTTSWTPTTGLPVPTYDLYRDGIMIRENVVSPNVHAEDPGSYEFHVVAVNSKGSTPSNTDTGSAIEIQAFPPGYISNFAATTNQTGQITCTWTNTTGLPLPTYNLYRGTTLIASNVVSGYIWRINNDENASYPDMHVKAVNSSGTVDSNKVTGTSLGVNPCISPSPISNLVAGDWENNQVHLTWTNSAGSSVQQDVYIGGDKIATNVSSPYTDNRSMYERTYHVVAHNACGSITSNYATNGIAIDPPGSIEYNTNGSHTFTVPKGYSQVTVCMIGGGGSGSAAGHSGHFGGGDAGQVVSTTLSVTAGSNISVYCGAGGNGVAPTNNGQAGGRSTCGSLSANGGAGGSWTTGIHAGNGSYWGYCYGTFQDGLMNNWSGSNVYGGKAGFGKGGTSAGGGANGQAGLKGAGGGAVAATGSTLRSGNGGVGVVRITWG